MRSGSRDAGSRDKDKYVLTPDWRHFVGCCTLRVSIPIYEVLGCFGPAGEVECEAVLEEERGDGAAGLEDQFSFGAEEEGADLEHPGGGGKSDGHAPRAAQVAQEVAVEEGVWRREVDRAGDFFMGDEELGGADVIAVVYPGDVLVAGAFGSAEA